MVVIGCYDDNTLSDDIAGESGVAVLQLMKNCQNEAWTYLRHDLNRHGDRTGYVTFEYIYLIDMT